MSESVSATNYVRSSRDCPFPAEPLQLYLLPAFYFEVEYTSNEQCDDCRDNAILGEDSSSIIIEDQIDKTVFTRGYIYPAHDRTDLGPVEGFCPLSIMFNEEKGDPTTQEPYFSPPAGPMEI